MKYNEKDKKRIQFDLWGDDLKIYTEVFKHQKITSGANTTFIQRVLFMQAIKSEFDKLKKQ